MLKKLRFSIYQFAYENRNHLRIEKVFIVLRNEFDDIVSWTNYANFVKPKKSCKDEQGSILDKCKNVVQFLNYAFFQKEIDSISEIDFSIISEFLNDYGMHRLEGDDEKVHRALPTIKKMKSAVIDFVIELIKNGQITKLKEKDLRKKEDKFDYRRKKYATVEKDTIEINYIKNYTSIFRDITMKAFDIIMWQIEIKHKEIYMLACLCAYAGLRPSEACNVRRPDSLLGPGLEFEIINGEIMNCFINISSELNLRSDVVKVGKIKNERKAQVHPNNLENFCRGYQIYMNYIGDKSYEKFYGPLTINRDGKAMTYDSFVYHFKKVIKEVIPIMLLSDDKEIVSYGIMLQQYGLSPHIFRHYFSMKLAINGASISELMSFRGDRQPESALVYIQNKSDLTKQLEEVGSKAFAYNLWRVSKIYDQSEQIL